MKNYFSSNLKYLREQKRISQNKLGELVGVNQTTIARWENEEMSPSIDNVVELSEIFEVSLGYLLGKDLSLKIEQEKLNLSKEQEQQLLKDVLKRKGFLDENEELTEENYNRLIDFAKANKQFIMKDNEKK